MGSHPPAFSGTPPVQHSQLMRWLLRYMRMLSLTEVWQPSLWPLFGMTFHLLHTLVSDGSIGRALADTTEDLLGEMSF